MMSQDDPNDLINSVTAEIEAIIQEEMNSQNSGLPVEVLLEESQPTEVQLPQEQAEVVESVQNEQEQIVVEETTDSNDVSTEKQEVFASEIENDHAVINEESITESSPSNPENDSEQVDTETTEVVEEKEQFVEYTVNIGSPSQERDIIAEISENINPIPLIETILTDAPIDENDGPRAKHLKQALRKALNNTVKSCSGDKLESCFPFNLKANQFSQINSTIIHALKSVIDGVQAPFDEFLKNENLVDKLNKVDEFTRSRVPGTSEASAASTISSFTPQNLVDRKLYSTKLAALAKLEQYTLKLESENVQLAAELNNRQTEFADRLDRLKSSQQLLDAALDQISTISMNDLEVLVDKMNYQYQPSALKFHN